MRKVIGLFIVLLLAICLGLKIAADPGYALFAYQGWTVEMPLWFTVLAAIVLFSVFYFFFRVIGSIASLSTKFRRWSGRWQMRMAHSRTTQGLIELTEGNWQTAEKLLIKSVPGSDSPLINYLAAARAAQGQGAHDRRDKYLRKAQKSAPDARAAVELTQAQLQISHGQLEQALATLRHLQIIALHHPYVLKLLYRLYVQLGDWDSLRNMLDDLMRKKILKEQEFKTLEIQVYSGLLQNAAKVEGNTHLQNVWESFPRTMQKQIRLVDQYADYLIQREAGEKAEMLLREILRKNWDDHLAILYGQAAGVDAHKQLAIAENWLKSRPNNAGLLLTLGRLCLRNQLWGKARTYLENSIELEPNAVAYAELANLLERIGEKDLAANYYRRGLICSITNKPKAPVTGYDIN